MPILEQLQARLGTLGGQVRLLFGVQHLFGSTATLLRRLTADRIQPDCVFLLGKPYSANPRVVRYLHERPTP